MRHLPKHMSNGTNADDNIKCLPEGDSHFNDNEIR